MDFYTEPRNNSDEVKTLFKSVSPKYKTFVKQTMLEDFLVPSTEIEEVEFVLGNMYKITKNEINILINKFPHKVFSDFFIRDYFLQACNRGITTRFLIANHVDYSSSDYNLLKKYSCENNKIVEFRQLNDNAGKFLNSTKKIVRAETIMNFATFDDNKFMFQVIPNDYSSMSSFNNVVETTELKNIFYQAFKLSEPLF